MIDLKDIVQLAETTSDGYGDVNVHVLTDVASLFLQSTGHTHSTNVDIANSDAHVYLDIDNPILLERGYRIEGMYIKANPFNADDSESWYRISKVVVGQRKLLENDVDNVHAYLQKVAEPEATPGVS